VFNKVQAMTDYREPRPTIVWWRSAVLWGIAISAGFKLAYLLFRWQSPFNSQEEQALAEVFTIFASLIGDTIAARGRFASNAQPITLTEETPNARS
jgi:prolipoprotein diacylglyceryltransferase